MELDREEMGSRAKFRVRVSEVIELGDVEVDTMGREEPTEHRLDLHAEVPIVEKGDIVYIGDEATRGGRAKVALDYGPHGRLGLLENVVDPDTETEGRERVALATTRGTVPHWKAVKYERGGTTIRPLVPTKEAWGKAYESGELFRPTEFVESILEVGRGEDQVGGGG